MKNIIIIIGTILLGIVIVNTLVLGSNENSLESTAGKIVESGSQKIVSTFDNVMDSAGTE